MHLKLFLLLHLYLQQLELDFSSTTTNYRMWFNTGTEVAPAAGGKTLILCNLTPTMTAKEVGLVIAQRTSKNQTNTITVTSVPPAGSYFTFNSNSTTYYVWYRVGGVGSAPVATAAQLIPVVLTGSETNAQVTSKTQIAINSKYFAVPDLRGYFLRGNDPTSLVDADNPSRYAYYANSLSYLGTYQLDQYGQHHHGLGNTATGGAASLGSTGSGDFTDTAGGFQTNPVNANVNWFIRY